jgi:AraC family transcriptional regulator
MRSAETPDFEVYDERFDAETGDGGVEIWVGVKPKS